MILNSNLISDSLLINETIKLLEKSEGKVSAVNVVDHVMKIRRPEPRLAKLLVSDLINSDPRLMLNDEFVEFMPTENGNKDLLKTNFVVFDFETTGAKCPPCRVTEIGACKIEDGKITDKFHTLINPEIPIPFFITQLTGISDEMVEDAPKFREIAGDFLDYIGDAVLVAHNAQFDMRFLNHEISRIWNGYKIANQHLCTVRLSRRLISNIENHKLKTVAEYFCINLENHHRAAHDAHATAEIFLNFLYDLKEKGINDLEGVRKFKAKQ